MCLVWQMRDISVFHIKEPSYLVDPKEMALPGICWQVGLRQLLAMSGMDRDFLWPGCCSRQGGKDGDNSWGRQHKAYCISICSPILPVRAAPLTDVSAGSASPH